MGCDAGADVPAGLHRAAAPSPHSGERDVGSYSIWDLQGRYNGFKNVALTLGIKNLLDTAPPFSTQNDTFQVGFDPTYGDPRGRIFYGSVKYAFK